MRTLTSLSLLIAFLLPAGPARAQLTFQRSIGGNGADFGSGLRPTTDHGYILAGTTSSFGAGGDDIYLLKLDSNGDTLWTRTYGGADDEYGSWVEQTTDGGYIVMGDSRSFGAQGKDLYVVKTDATGAPMWSKLYGGAGNDYGRDIHQTGDGGYLIAGSTSQGAGVVDAYVIKIDGNGSVLWTRIYGGALEDDGNSLRLTNDGGFILAGITLSSGAGGVDVYVVKANANGDTTWTRSYGGAGDDYAFAIEQTTDGGYCIAGSTTSGGAGGYDCSLMRIDAAGALLWTKTYGSAATDITGSVKQTADGGYILLGQSYGFSASSDIYLVKTNASGDTTWTSTYGGGGYEFESVVLQTQDGGYLFSAGEESFGTDRNAYLVKTDALGNSGCDQGTTTSAVGAISFVASGTATIVASGGSPVTAATLISRGGTITTPCTTASVPELPNTDALTIYPVPFFTSFHLSGTEKNGSLVVMDITGKVCASQPTMEGITVVDMSSLQSGPYLLSYHSATRNSVIKLVKE